ncbi:unnamed protein product [Nippostrongylus brasiliensis]|uniref:DRIM domain-containing protein n=1 Tax=Nippostrongylus brasiliensis TaxID=27835 RepID=A0A0N4Y488_NIPBR|nr:unnamed protein product [Nippostrongylus brasiliensis]
MFIIKALKGLESPKNPLFRRYFYLLENLSVVSTLVLCLELPQDDANQVIRLLLKTAMEVANGKEWKRETRETSADGSATDDDGEEKSDNRDKVIALLIGMITKLLRDVDQVSTEVLDVLFFYLINPQKLNNRESYNMARQIIQVSQTSLEAAVQSLLTQSLLSGGLPQECDLVGSGRKKLHDVILELHEVAPELVAPVLPQICSSLRAEDDQQRLLATKLVGKLASSAKALFYDDHPKLWKFYLDRFKDTSNEVRETCAKDAHEILLRHCQLRGQISSSLSSLTRDLDDSPKIRQEVIAKLLHLYFKVVMSEEHTASETASVAIIPKRALALYMLASMTEEKLMIERYFSSYIIPYKMEMTKRVRSMVELFARLDKFEAHGQVFKLKFWLYSPDSVILMNRQLLTNHMGIQIPLSTEFFRVFAEIVARSAVHRRILREMLDIISRQAASEDKAQLQSKIQRISSTHHDPTGFSIALKHFANLLSTDQKCFEYAEYLVSNEYTTSRVEEVCKELVARSLDVGTIPKDCLTNIRRYVERVAPLVMDQDSAAEFLKVLLRLQSDAECSNMEAIAKLPSTLRLFKVWGESFPNLFSRSDAVHSILKMVGSDDVKIVEAGLQVMYHISLQSSLKVKEQDWCSTAVDQVWDVLKSENDGFGRCCKLAVRVTCRLLGKEECTKRFNEIYQEIEERVTMDNPGACVNAMQVIAEFHRDLPQEFGPRVKSLITDVIVSGFILSPETDHVEVAEDFLKPLEEQPVSVYCAPKIYGMKLLARYLFTCSGEAEDDSLAMKTFKMLKELIAAGGDIHDPCMNISVVERAWLRAVAGSSLLKLCYIQKYSQMMSVDQFAVLANLMIDPAECVRSYFVRRLNKGISRNRLTIEYLALFSLAGLLQPADAEEESTVKSYRDQCRGFLVSAINRRRGLIQSPGFSSMYLPYHQPEYVVAYSVWLLANQPMLTTHTNLTSMAALQECLWFVIDTFLPKKESTDFEFIYRLLQDIKESNDAQYEKRHKKGEIGEAEVVGHSKKMWALADLGMLMLTYRAKVTIRHEPRKPLLSTRFFIRDKKSTHAGTVYAPHELIDDEKERNGKLPVDGKGRSFNTTSNVTKKGSKNATKLRKARTKREKDMDSSDTISSPERTNITSNTRRHTNRVPLKVEQESVVVRETRSDRRKPPSSSEEDITNMKKTRSPLERSTRDSHKQVLSPEESKSNKRTPPSPPPQTDVKRERRKRVLSPEEVKSDRRKAEMSPEVNKDKGKLPQSPATDKRDKRRNPTSQEETKKDKRKPQTPPEEVRRERRKPLPLIEEVKASTAEERKEKRKPPSSPVNSKGAVATRTSSRTGRGKSNGTVASRSSNADDDEDDASPSTSKAPLPSRSLRSIASPQPSPATSPVKASLLISSKNGTTLRFMAESPFKLFPRFSSVIEVYQKAHRERQFGGQWTAQEKLRESRTTKEGATHSNGRLS